MKISVKRMQKCR